MAPKYGYIWVKLAVLAVIALAVSGCGKDLPTSISAGSSNSKAAEKQLTKIKDEMQLQLPAEMVSTYPGAGKLARVYVRVQNKTGKELEAVRFAAMVGTDLRDVGSTTIYNLKPNEIRSFDIQTSENITEFVTEAKVKATDVRIKGAQ